MAHNVWSPPLPSQSANGVVYLSLTNHTDEAVKLTGASSSVAKKVEIHRMINENGLMKMQPVDGGVTLAPQQTVEFVPGGLHIMLVGLKQPMETGNEFNVLLSLANTEPLDISVKVQDKQTAGAEVHSH